MKIIHIITGLNGGGAEKTLFKLVTNNTINSHFIVSLTGCGKFGPKLAEAGIPTICLGLSADFNRVGPGILKLIQLIRKEKPDVVQTWMYHADFIGGICGRLAGVRKVFWNLRISFPTSATEKRRTVLLAATLGLLSWSIPSKIVTCGLGIHQSHIRWGYSAKNMHPIPNGYSLPASAPQSRDGGHEEKLGSGKRITFLQLANYQQRKGHSVLFTSLAELGVDDLSIQLILVGAGTEKSNARLTNEIASYGLESIVERLGFRDDIDGIFPIADYVISPSLSEGFPNAVAEAMANSVPCLVSDVGESSAIVGDTGWVFKPGSPESMQIALVEAMGLPAEERAQMGRRARRRIESLYSLEKMSEAYDALYRG